VQCRDVMLAQTGRRGWGFAIFVSKIQGWDPRAAGHVGPSGCWHLAPRGVRRDGGNNDPVPMAVWVAAVQHCCWPWALRILATKVNFNVTTSQDNRQHDYKLLITARWRTAATIKGGAPLCCQPPPPPPPCLRHIRLCVSVLSELLLARLAGCWWASAASVQGKRPAPSSCCSSGVRWPRKRES